MIVVVATRYFAVSNRKGEISIPNVLAGPYELHVWNERSLPKELDVLTRRLSVSESAHTLGTIILSAGPKEVPTHKNKYGRNYDSATPPNSLYSQP